MVTHPPVSLYGEGITALVTCMHVKVKGRKNFEVRRFGISRSPSSRRSKPPAFPQPATPKGLPNLAPKEKGESFRESAEVSRVA